MSKKRKFDKCILIWQNTVRNAESEDNTTEVENNKKIESLKQILFELNKNFKFYYATYFFFSSRDAKQ